MPWHPTMIDSEILSVHAALVPVGPKGTVLMFGGSEHWSAQGGTDEVPADPADIDRTALFDVNTRAVTRTTSPTTDVFCAGHAFIGDGRLLIAGGTEVYGGEEAEGPGGGHGHFHGNFGGHTACWIYNHHQNNWVRTADLTFAGPGGGRWYPSLITLPSGDVVAFGGHPSRRSMHWHENDLPERFSARGHGWTRYPTALPFEHGSLPGNWYPRLSLVRGGTIFFTTVHNGQCRFWNPADGQLVGPVVGAAPSPYNSGWDYAVIQLPLVPGDDYRSRILAVGGVSVQKIELNTAGSPTWGSAGTRQPSAAGKAREFVCPVYLPTGQIIVTGGINGSLDTDAVKVPEVYTPDIDWTTLAYGAGTGTWATIEEPAQIARNYHSVALLLPDGSVFTASSSIDGDPGDPDTEAQKNIEVFFPPSYFDDPNRPSLVGAPLSLNYHDTSFVLTTGSTAQAASIRKVALIRCGSVTHAGDFDQRYVALTFSHQAGTANLLVDLPNDPSVLPPGNYMAWIVDSNELPCQVAKFVRVAHQSCTVITDRSTFSREEVEAVGGGGQAPFANAVYVQYDGFTHLELTGTPSVSVTWDDNGTPVNAADFSLVAAARLQEVNPGFADTPQRITFPFNVVFHNLNTYNGFTDTRLIRITFTLGSLTCSQTLDLTYDPNPYMVDINPVTNNPAWLSTDVRVFAVEAGQTKFGDVVQGMTNPIPFVRACIDKLNDPAENGEALFEGLATDAKLDLASNGAWPASLPIYNYAIARVRYRATTTTATNVKCFFRMFNVAATGLEFNPNTTYDRTTVGPNTVPLLGTAGGEIASIPFFATERQETVQGRPGAATMENQNLTAPYETRNIAPDAGQEVSVFFGAWLDINQTTKRFPINPGGTHGPWAESSCRSIQELVRGRHMCVVAEVFFEPDETQPGETPESSDNLSQRNLAILHSDNPGGPDSHTVMHTLEVKPSLLPKGPIGVPDTAAFPTFAAANLEAVHSRYRLDELIFRWHDLPADSEVTLYFSDIDTDDIRRLAAFRHSPLAFEVVDKHTLKFKVAGATWVPLPGGRQLNIPALVSIKLPDTVVYGDEYRVSVHQVNGRDGCIIGACELRIVVSKAELIVDEEIRTLSVFKHIVSTIPTDNRWYPLMKRYVHHLGLKIRELGGDPDGVHGNPDGSGRPYDPLDETGGKPGARPCCGVCVSVCCCDVRDMYARARTAVCRLLERLAERCRSDRPAARPQRD